MRNEFAMVVFATALAILVVAALTWAQPIVGELSFEQAVQFLRETVDSTLPKLSGPQKAELKRVLEELAAKCQ